MLEAMRRNTKVILWITVIFFVLLIFLVWGADLEFGSKAPQGAVGSVNGETISVQEYQTELAQNRDAARRGGRELSPTDELMIEEQTWNNIVERKLLEQQAAKRNLGARDAEVRSILLNNPPPFITQNPNFQNDKGQFDLATYRSLITDPSVPENVLVQLEDQVRSYLPLQKIQDVVVSAAKVTEDELRNAYRDQNQKVKATYALVAAPAGAVNQTVTDDEIQAWYKDHQEDYRLPERFTLQYVTVPRVATAADSAQILADLRELAGEAREAEAAKTEGREDIEHSSFETLAMSFSDGPNADKGGLSTGYLLPSEMSPAMRQAVDDLPKGEVTKPFKDGNSFHIVQVADTQDKDGQRAVQIRDLSMKIAASDSTVSAVRDQLDQVRQDAQGSSLKDAAESHGLQIQTAEDVTATGIVPGLSAVPQITAFATQNPVGTLSRVYATTNAWYLVQITGRTPEGVPPLDQVTSRVRNDILQDRMLTAARAKADRITGQVKMGQTLEAAAAADSIPVTQTPEFTRRTGVPALGRDPEVLGTAFALPVGRVSAPIKTPRGWVILRVDERPDVDWTAFDTQKAQLRQQLLAAKQNRIYAAWMDQIRKKAKIEDYRTS